MTFETRTFDVAHYLTTEEEMNEYLNACFEDGNAALIADAIGMIAKARGMTEIAKETNLGREGLYKGLSSKGNPSFATMLKVLSSLGITLSIKPKEQSRA
jgi:probable addiction module antidote protein